MALLCDFGVGPENAVPVGVERQRPASVSTRFRTAPDHAGWRFLLEEGRIGGWRKAAKPKLVGYRALILLEPDGPDCTG